MCWCCCDVKLEKIHSKALYRWATNPGVIVLYVISHRALRSSKSRRMKQSFYFDGIPVGSNSNFSSRFENVESRVVESVESVILFRQIPGGLSTVISHRFALS
jgi:hypothetical protein